MFEQVLGTLEAAEEGHRVELVQVADVGTQPALELRMQCESETGWVTTRRVRLAPGQVPGLKAALQFMDAAAKAPARAADDTSKVCSLADYRALAG